MKPLPLPLRKKAQTSAQRKVRFSTLLHKVFAAGWRHSWANHTVLTRPLPYKTRDTYYTQVFRSNDSAVEHIASINLQFCGRGNRVWKKLI